MQLHAVADPATPKATPPVDREADASSDDEGLETEDEEVTSPKKSKSAHFKVASPTKSKRANFKRAIASYELVERWVTGDRAVMPDEDIDRQLFEHARHLMHLSGLKKLPGHKGKDSDLALWKKWTQHTSRKTGVTYILYRCPLHYRCNCKCSIRVVIGQDFKELQRCGLHDANSHADDGSKYLKYDQIISVSEAVVSAPTASGATLRRNMLMHGSPSKTIPAERVRSVQNRVYTVRKALTRKQLQTVSDVSDGFGDLASFLQRNNFSELVRRHRSRRLISSATPRSRRNRW